MELAELDAGFNAGPVPVRNPGVSLTFFHRVDKDDEETKKQGRPVFKEYEYVRAMVAGDRGNVVERPATPMDKLRYPDEYRAFQARSTQQVVGFPLSQWPGVLRSQVEELKFYGVHTVEELAAVSDVNAQSFPSFRSLRDKAKKYLEDLTANAPLEKMEAELKARDEKIEALQETVNNLLKKLEADEDV